MQFGIIGSGSWATALAKILTDNGNKLHWWIRNEESIRLFLQKAHNPHYLSSAHFDLNTISLSNDLVKVVQASDVLVVAVPAAYLAQVFALLSPADLKGKKIISAVKGILPEQNKLLNEVLQKDYQFSQEDYFTVMGPCHAEEVAEEKLSYLTFSGLDENTTGLIAQSFQTPYLKTVVNTDVYGVQYAAILKNIYALGAGMAHGLDYGDNFLSVFIANSADEMAVFLRKAGIMNAEVGYLEHGPQKNTDKIHHNYTASVYLGDLLVTCYSLHSRNRSFGNMIGKGYSVKAAQLEMNMVAEGYNASKCMHLINQQILAEMPIAETIFRVLWEGLSPKRGFEEIESWLV